MTNLILDQNQRYCLITFDTELKNTLYADMQIVGLTRADQCKEEIHGGAHFGKRVLNQKTTLQSNQRNQEEKPLITFFPSWNT